MAGTSEWEFGIALREEQGLIDAGRIGPGLLAFIGQPGMANLSVYAGRKGFAIFSNRNPPEGGVSAEKVTATICA